MLYIIVHNILYNIKMHNVLKENNWNHNVNLFAKKTTYRRTICPHNYDPGFYINRPTPLNPQMKGCRYIFVEYITQL